ILDHHKARTSCRVISADLAEPGKNEAASCRERSISDTLSEFLRGSFRGTVSTIPARGSIIAEDEALARPAVVAGAEDGGQLLRPQDDEKPVITVAPFVNDGFHHDGNENPASSGDFPPDLPH